MNRITTLLPAALLSISVNANAQTFTNRTDLLSSESGNGFFPFGASSIDVNQDGRVDIFQPGSSRLYLNQGEAGFIDAYSDSGLNEGEASFGGIFADYDEDGFLDVFFMDLIQPSNLFKANSDGTYTQTDAIAGINTDETPVQGSVWLDFDNDGMLDLFVGGDGTTDILFKNIGLNQFENAEQFLGLEFERAVYGAAAADFDRDGDLDIFIGACDQSNPERSRNMLWLNENGTFVEADLGIDHTGDAWGVVWLDYDNDGWLDLYVVNAAGSGNLLYQNNREGGFEEVGESAGVAGSASDYGFSASAADFDNDGWTDIYVVNRNRTPDRLFHNNGDGTFTNIFSESNVTDIENFAVTVADYNDDGYIDLFLGTIEGGELYFNDGGESNWLKVSLQGVDSNRAGIGARVEVYRDGLPDQVREISAGDGMTSQNHALIAHFGLGDELVVDSVYVRWPGGTIDRLVNVQADQHLVITEGQASTSREQNDLPIATSIDVYPNPTTGSISVSFELSSPESVAIHVFDVLGRRIDTLVRGHQAVGPVQISWNGLDHTGIRVSPGVYYIQIVSGSRSATKSVTISP